MMADSLESALDSEEMEDETEAEVDRVSHSWVSLLVSSLPHRNRLDQRSRLRAEENLV